MADSPQTLAEANELRVHFPVRGGVLGRTQAWCKAVDGVSLHLSAGETLGVVGESGCGKTTLGKAFCRLVLPTEGEIRVSGEPINKMRGRRLKAYRRQVQMIFQDPADSLNSRQTVGEILEEPFIIHRLGDRPTRTRRVRTLLDAVGLAKGAENRYPFEFSGGQRQRISIARAIALDPHMVVCDEPVSALDVSVQSQILNLLLDLQTEKTLAYLFISHDLAVVRHVSDRIAVMYLGKVVELADRETLFKQPLHAYTKALISAVPQTDPSRRGQRIILKGDLPSPINPPAGCAFAGRSSLPHSPEQAAQPGHFMEVSPGHWVEVHPATVENWQDYLPAETFPA